MNRKAHERISSFLALTIGGVVGSFIYGVADPLGSGVSAAGLWITAGVAAAAIATYVVNAWFLARAYRAEAEERVRAYLDGGAS